MSSDKNTRKFPRGYDVTIVRKEDVLEAIDDNIIDKEIALDLIKQLELDASNFIKEGRWTSLPFIGTIRYNENKKAIIDNIDVVRQAEKTMSKQEYVMFRKKLVIDNESENGLKGILKIHGGYKVNDKYSGNVAPEAGKADTEYEENKSIC